MDCKHASQLITQGMDRPLNWQERLGLWVHLRICGMCRQFFNQVHLIRNALRRMVNHAESDESVKLPEEVRARIHKVLDRQP